MVEQSAGGPAGRGLSEILAPIAADLRAVDEEIDEVLKPSSAKVRPLVEHIARFRGKMLRPAVAILSARCFAPVRRAHHQVAAIVEMIHLATLVHDDVLDAAERRRGLATANASFGNEAAVLLGDFVFSTAFSLSAALEDRLASRYLSFIAGIVCQGEILQILASGNLDLSEEDYLEQIEKKTAFLFAAAARVGAEYAGAPSATAEALSVYGLSLGTAFQIIDDCLDFEGEEASVGKTLGTDARQGKATLPVIHFLREAPADRVRRLRAIVAGGEGEERRGEIRDLLAEAGSLEYAHAAAARHAGRAEAALAAVPEGEWRDALAALAAYSVRRSR